MGALERVAILLVCGTAAIGPSNAAPVEQMIVQNNFTSGVCAGFCVDETVIVSADGRVSWKMKSPRGFHLTLKHPVRRFLVKPDAAAAFIRAMSEIKPKKSISDSNGCDTALHVAHMWDWEITWNGSGGHTELRSCDGDQRVVSAWRIAIKALGMPWGLAGEMDEGVIELPAE